MKQTLTILLLFILAIGCKPVKKAQTINAAISKKDTAQTVIIKEVERVDSTTIIKEILSKVAKQKKDFTTFNAKLKIDYEGQETSQKVTGYLSIKKDSAIFITISAPIFGVVMKVFVNKDSIILINQLKKTVQNRSISYLQESTQIPFDFSTLQDVIVGNPIFITNNIISYKATNKEFLVFMTGKIFKHLLTLDNIDFKPTHSKLDDVDALQNRTCDITFSNYETKGDIQFATYRSISVSQKSKLDIYLDFKDYKFNEQLNYSFSIPKNYKRL